MNDFGERLKRSREERELTQKQLALLTHVNQSSISAYESGQKIPSVDVAARIAEALNTSLGSLCGETHSRILRTYGDVLNALEDVQMATDSVIHVEGDTVQLSFQQKEIAKFYEKFTEISHVCESNPNMIEALGSWEREYLLFLYRTETELYKRTHANETDSKPLPSKL